MRYDAGVSTISLVVTSNNLILHQYLNHKNINIITDIFSPMGMLLVRSIEKNVLKGGNPRGKLLASGTDQGVLFRRLRSERLPLMKGRIIETKY